MDDVGIGKLLERLGLTEYEAKTLGALFRIREAEAPEVSRLAQVPKTRVYDVLDRLIKKGLVIEIYGRPKKYRVVNPSDAIEELIEKKKQEVRQLEEKTTSMKDFIAGWDKAQFEEGEKVMKVKDKQDFEKILSQEIENAKNNIMAFAEINKNQPVLKEAIKKAKLRNIEVKILGKISKELRHTAKDYMSTGAELKHCEHGLNAFIIDRKNVVLALSDFAKEKPEYHFTIWHDNQPLAKALNHYFQNCWEKAKKP